MVVHLTVLQSFSKRDRKRECSEFPTLSLHHKQMHECMCTLYISKYKEENVREYDNIIITRGGSYARERMSVSVIEGTRYSSSTFSTVYSINKSDTHAHIHART